MSPCPYCKRADSHRHSVVIDGGHMTVDGRPACDVCHEAVPTVSGREFTGGPDGDLCDECVREYNLSQRENVQW